MGFYIEKKWKWKLPCFGWGTRNWEFSLTGNELSFWCPSLLRGSVTTIKALLMFYFSVATVWKYKLHTQAARHLAHCCSPGCSLSDTSHCPSKTHFGSVFVNHLIRFLLLTEKSPLLKHQTGISSASNIDKDRGRREREHQSSDTRQRIIQRGRPSVCVWERKTRSFCI